MGRRNKSGRKIDGWLVIDKPLEATSAQIVRVLKRALNPLKIGHAGTLDPLATGILPIGLGEATKTMSYITDSSKDYVFEIKWGQETSTDDREGEIVNECNVLPNKDDIENILSSFTGSIEQVPPQYSAIKIDGKRAYKRARDGENIEMPIRKVEIHALNYDANESTLETGAFRVTCGKGTYIRALARDIARKLGTFGHLISLRRTRVGPFLEKDAISLDLQGELSHIARAEGQVLPVMTALDDISALAISDFEAERIRCGQSLKLPTEMSGVVVLTLDDLPVALAVAKDGMLSPKRVFNLTI